MASLKVDVWCITLCVQFYQRAPTFKAKHGQAISTLLKSLTAVHVRLKLFTTPRVFCDCHAAAMHSRCCSLHPVCYALEPVALHRQQPTIPSFVVCFAASEVIQLSMYQ